MHNAARETWSAPKISADVTHRHEELRRERYPHYLVLGWVSNFFTSSCLLFALIHSLPAEVGLSPSPYFEFDQPIFGSKPTSFLQEMKIESSRKY